jgi:hypothetical protein
MASRSSSGAGFAARDGPRLGQAEIGGTQLQVIDLAGVHVGEQPRVVRRLDPARVLRLRVEGRREGVYDCGRLDRGTAGQPCAVSGLGEQVGGVAVVAGGLSCGGRGAPRRRSLALGRPCPRP